MRQHFKQGEFQRSLIPPRLLRAMKNTLLIVSLLLASLVASAHGNSNIEGYFELRPAEHDDSSLFILHLTPLEAHALDGLEVQMRLGQEFLNPFVELEKVAEGEYKVVLPLQDGHYNLRVYLSGNNRDEIGLGGFTWVRGKEIAHTPESEVWFVPRGQFEPIPWADHVSGIIVGLLALIVCIILLIRRKTHRAYSGRQHSTWIVVMATLAALMMPFGAYWDISAHAVSGRESFFQPPHLMIYGGILLCMALVVLAIGRKPATIGWKAHLRSDRYAFGAVIALLVQLSSAPFDELWHNMFGLDVSVWSPPHVILIFGGFAVCLYLSLLQVAQQTTTLSALKLLTIGGALLIVNVFLAEFEFPMPSWHISQQRPAWTFPVLMSFFAIIAGYAARRGTTLSWSASGAIAAYLMLRLLASSFLVALGQPVLPSLHWWLFLLPLIGVGIDIGNKYLTRNEIAS